MNAWGAFIIHTKKPNPCLQRFGSISQWKMCSVHLQKFPVLTVPEVLKSPEYPQNQCKAIAFRPQKTKNKVPYFRCSGSRFNIFIPKGRNRET
jgi:hypothetical protein